MLINYSSHLKCLNSTGVQAVGASTSAAINEMVITWVQSMCLKWLQCEDTCVTERSSHELIGIIGYSYTTRRNNHSKKRLLTSISEGMDAVKIIFQGTEHSVEFTIKEGNMVHGNLPRAGATHKLGHLARRRPGGHQMSEGRLHTRSVA